MKMTIKTERNINFVFGKGKINTTRTSERKRKKNMVNYRAIDNGTKKTLLASDRLLSETAVPPWCHQGLPMCDHKLDWSSQMQNLHYYITNINKVLLYQALSHNV